MKTKSTVGRLLTHFSEWRKSGARVAAMLLLLCTTALPAWAYRYSWSEENYEPSEGEGGKYRCSGETDDVDEYLYHNRRVDFTTYQSINLAEDKFYWTATIDVFCCSFDGGTQKLGLIGEIYVVTADGVKHKIATWTKDKDSEDDEYDAKDPIYSRLKTFEPINREIIDTQWGALYVSDMYSDKIAVRYMPSLKAMQEGVKCFVMKVNMMRYTDPQTFCGREIEEDLGWVQYEKDIQCPTFNDSNPMPKFSSVAWKTDGSLRGVATDVPDKRSNNNYTQNYEVTMYYYQGDKQSRTTT
jgi:hypothetical protein